jgi:hypothetical protein
LVPITPIGHDGDVSVAVSSGLFKGGMKLQSLHPFDFEMQSWDTVDNVWRIISAVILATTAGFETTFS